MAKFISNRHTFTSIHIHLQIPRQKRGRIQLEVGVSVLGNAFGIRLCVSLVSQLFSRFDMPFCMNIFHRYTKAMHVNGSILFSFKSLKE